MIEKTYKLTRKVIDENNLLSFYQFDKRLLNLRPHIINYFLESANENKEKYPGLFLFANGASLNVIKFLDSDYTYKVTECIAEDDYITIVTEKDIPPPFNGDSVLFIKVNGTVVYNRDNRFKITYRGLDVYNKCISEKENYIKKTGTHPSKIILPFYFHKEKKFQELDVIIQPDLLFENITCIQ